MAEQVAGMVLEKIVDKLVDPIIRQFLYLFCYKSNIKMLADKVKDIQNSKTDVTRQVDQAQRNLEIIGSEVETWLGKVQDIEKTADEILHGTDKVKNGCLNGWCPNLKQRYLLSRKAVKQTVIVKELRSEVEKYAKLAHPALPPCMEEFSSTAVAEVFESRVSKTKEVIEALKDESLTMIGICGLGGIGKTKMAYDVRARVKTENLFDEVTMVVVSQNLDLKNIQDQLASMLELKLEANNSIVDRGRRLSQRLSKGKRTLVILDDIWEHLDLDKIGIPVGVQGHSTGCKVLITSRDEHVCFAMNTHKNFTIRILSNGEAWDLFKQTAGDCVTNISDLNPIATEVSNECGGLPLAIVTVATALKGFEKHVWIDALQQLKTCCVSRIVGMDAKVYSSLRLSYDYLKIKYGGTENECNQQQQLFLLCCLFPEDCDISVELLFRFAMGLGFINNQDLEFARIGVHALTDQLRSCYLLLPSDKDGHVKVHDVLRDFGLREASGVYFSRHDHQLKEWPLNDEVERHTAISIGSQEDVKLPLGLDCPLLQLLQLSGPGSIHMSKDYFGAMKELRVVSLEKKSISFHDEPKSSPKALEFFMNVQTLCLESCRFDTNIGIIGCLRKLKILSFYCCEIEVLPREIGQLNNLKLLDLRESKLGSIAPGVLSCLKKLEDLYMGKYFHVKEVEEHNEEQRASITELYSLPTGLKTLQVYVSNDKDLLKLKDFSFHKLKRFDISTGRFYYYSGRYEFLGVLKLEKANLNLFQEAEFAGVLRRAEVIFLDRVYGQKSIMKADEDGFMNLKKLRIEHNEDMVEICEGNLPPGSIGMLEELELRNLHAMRHLWRGRVQHPSLVNLKVVVVWSCHDLVNLFSSSAARCLVQLQKLRVECCNKLEEIVSKVGSEYENDTNMIKFPQLKVMKIVDLPSFKSLVAVGYNNNHSRSIFNEALLPSMETLSLNAVHVVKLLDGKTNPASFNKLERVNVRKCHSMEVVFDLEEVDVLNEDGAKVMVFGQLHIINLYDLPELKHIWKNAPKERLQAFQNLKTLHLDRCYKIEYLLSVSMAKLLVNLEQIHLYKCKQMEQVIKMDDDEEEGITKKTNIIVFPQLRWILFRNVGLKVFYQGNHHLEFPALEKVTIIGCPNMNNFCSGSLTTPKLMSVVTGTDESIWMGDLNETAHSSKKYVKEEEYEKLMSRNGDHSQRTCLEIIYFDLLKVLGVDDIIGFDFMEKPDRMGIIKSLESSYLLGALTEEGKLSDPVGHQMARLPVEPVNSKALILSSQFDCLEEMLISVAMLSVESIFYAPREKLQESRTALRNFASSEGDHLTLLNVYRAADEFLEKSRIVFLVFLACSCVLEFEDETE